MHQLTHIRFVYYLETILCSLLPACFFSSRSTAEQHNLCTTQNSLRLNRSLSFQVINSTIQEPTVEIENEKCFFEIHWDIAITRVFNNRETKSIMTF